MTQQLVSWDAHILLEHLVQVPATIPPVQLSARALPGMTEILGFLPLPGEAKMEFWAPGYGLGQLWLSQASGE